MASRKNEIKTNIEANSEGFIKAMDEVKRSISSTRTEFANINAIMKSTGETTDQLRGHKKQLQTEIDNTKSRLDILNKGLEESIKVNGEESEATRIAREEVQKASTHYENLKQKLKEVNDKLDDQTFSLKSVSSGFEKVSDATGKFASKIKWVSAGAGSLLGLSAKTAIEFEDAFVGVKKTVEGTDEELEQIRKEIMALSNRIPLATTELFALAEEAGQLGIKTADITNFTETMAKLGTATNLSATEAGQAIATFVNVMGTLPENYERIGSVIVELGNNSKATEADIVSMAQRMSGAGATLGMSESSILGLATALSSVGLEAEMGGTAISRVMNDFNRAANGVETKYGSLKQYAEICGMSTKEFANVIQNDAGEAVKQFVIGLGDTNRTGKSTIQLMSDLGINEVRLTDTMLRLANASGTVEEYMAMADAEWINNNALTTEAEKKYADTASQIETTKNKFGEVADKLGKVLLPIINDELNFLGKLTDKFNQLSTGTQKTIVKVLAFTTALAPVSKGISSITKGVSETIKFVDKTSKPLQTLYKNITNVDSRTVVLSKDVKEGNSLFDKYKTTIDKLRRSNKSLKVTITDVNTKIKNANSQVKEGIDYWYQTTSGVDKLKIGIVGLVGTTVSLKGFSSSIKSIADEGANFGNISSSIVSGISSITSAASTGVAIGGTYGAVIGAIGSSIGLVISGISSWLQANDESRANLESTKETFSNFKTSIDGIKDSYNQNIQSAQESTTSQMMYISKMQELSNEMANFIDVNGKVKDSDTERANVIMTLLNESLGTQLVLEDGVIKNGQQIISSKEQFIALTEKSAESIKKETLLESYQSQYKSAIDAQTKAKQEYNNALADEEKNIANAIEKYKRNEITVNELLNVINTSSKAKQEAEKKYQDVLSYTDKVINGLSDVTRNYAKTSSSELEKTINKIMSTNDKTLDETSKLYATTYDNAKKTAELGNEEITRNYELLKKTFEKPSKFSIVTDYKDARYQTNRFINDYNRSMSNASSPNSRPVSFTKLQNIPANAMGTVVTKPTLSWIGENGAEAIVPLEKNIGWINKVAEQFKHSFVDTMGINTDYLGQNDGYMYSEEYLADTVDLLERILAKPSHTYLDGRRISEATASTDDVASGDLLEKLERGLVV